MLIRPDLIDASTPAGIEIFQLTTDPSIPACHVYMEAQVFTPDSRYFLLQKGVNTHGSDHKDPAHQYYLCEVATGELIQVTDEPGVTAPSLSPDGKYFYYFVNRSLPGSGLIILKRRHLDGSCPEVIAVLDSFFPGTRFYPSNPYTLSTISSDGRKLAISCFLGDGRSEAPPFGLVVFDLYTGESNLILHGPSWCNMHPQYSRSIDPEASRDLLIQENHGSLTRPDGKIIQGGKGFGADVHVIRDDGHQFRNIPWGRTEDERVIGHQCWRGDSQWVVGGIATGGSKGLADKNSELTLMESLAVPHEDHEGRAEPNAIRNDLCRGFSNPHFNHSATDAAGNRLIADFRESWDYTVPFTDGLYLFELGEPGRDKAKHIQYLLSPRSSWKGSAHIHPFLSPDGKIAFFNSDESGVTQAYMVRGLPEYNR